MQTIGRTYTKISARAFLLAALLLLVTLLTGNPSPAQAAAPGSVVAWGYNALGQTNVPAGLNSVTAIAARGFHSLALKSDGTVVAWGDNFYGESSVPAGLSGVIAIAAGDFHSLALKGDGTVSAWGDNSVGQLSVPAGLSGVTAIAAGGFHSLALTSDGSVVAWGDNFYGQTDVPRLSLVTVIAAGVHHSVAATIIGGEAWGDNRSGQSSAPNLGSNVTALAAGSVHSLALVNSRVVAWGDNSVGQLSVPAGLSGFTAAIAAGAHHSLALKGDGTVVAWGDNSVGQLSVPAGLSGVTAIAAGGAHNLALVPPDTTAPVITPSIDGTLGSNGWYVSNVTVSWTVTDNETPISSQSGCGSTPIDPDIGTTTLTCTATSAGGTASQSVTILHDATAPSISVSAKKADNTAYTAGTWTNQNVTVHFTCSDTLSGIASCPTDVVLSSDGVTASVSGTASDNAGNSASASFGPTQMIDKTAPSISVSAKKADNTAYTTGTWTNQNVTVHFTCSDTLSGIASCPADVVLSSDGVTPSVSGTATDNAGNSATASFGPIQIDKTKPSIACGAADGLWHAADVSIACTASDGTSGLANAADASFNLTTSVASGTENANASTNSRSVADLAGNAATAGPIAGNKIDKKVPSISITAPTATSYILNQTVAANYSCSDSGSGLASCVGTVANGSNIDTASVGAKTFSVNAADNIANASSASVSYNVIYNFGGFFQPVDNLPAFNQLKAGAAVPVKFSLGGDFGLDILAAGSPTSQGIACDATSTVDDIEETVTAGASSLSYDPLIDRYHYVWKTQKGWAGTCRQLLVTLDDGSVHKAYFKFK